MAYFNDGHRTVALPNKEVGIEITEADQEPRIAASRPTIAEAEIYIRFHIMMDIEAEKKIGKTA